MKRIPLCSRRASPAILFEVAVVAASIAIGCFPDGQREGLPTLYLNPPSALQGASLIANLSAEGIELDRCDKFGPSSLKFENSAGESQITVDGIDVLGIGAARAQISVAQDAVVGGHRALLYCDDNATLIGSLEVRANLEEPALTLYPASSPAGVVSMVLHIRSYQAHFSQGVSHVVFGNGEYVTIDKLTVVNANDIDLTADVSYKTPAGEMDVAVITGAEVARGKFHVTERIYPTIQVEPDEVFRPEIGAPQVKVTLDIRGEGVEFKEASADAGPDDPEATKVDFPHNPGISVSSISVKSSSRILVNIKVDEIAVLGPTPLRVTTGDQVAETDFAVLPSPGSKVLMLSPSYVPRGSKGAVVAAKAVNFSFDGLTDVWFSEQECDVDSYEVQPSGSPSTLMSVRASVDAAFTGDEATLNARVDGEVVQARLMISDDSGAFLLPPDPAQIVQGEDSLYVLLEIENGTFSSDAVAEVLSRSGIKIVRQILAGDGKTMTLRVKAANDAPIGPALVRVDNGGVFLETVLEVQPSGDVPHVALSPQVLMAGRQDATIDLTSTDIDFDTEETAISFDDPAVQAAQVQFQSTSRARVSASIAPTARNDVAVVYVKAGDKSAAAAYRTVGKESFAATATPSEISRTAGQKGIIVIQATGAVFEGTVAQIMDDIGIEVKRVTPVSDNEVELELSVDETGPGGWIGVLLTTKHERLVVPIHIDGDDESLTASLSPASLPVGSVEAQVRVTAPDQAKFNQVLTEVSTVSKGSYVALKGLVSDAAADLLFDISFEAEIPQNGVPVLITAEKGAVVGFMQSKSIVAEALSEDDPWQATLKAGETRLISVEPEEQLSFVFYSSGGSGVADPRIDLLSEGALVAEESGCPEPLWLLGDDAKSLTVSAVWDPDGNPFTLDMFYLGGAVTWLAEPDDAQSQAADVPSDPCSFPYLAAAKIDGALDLDRLELGATSCRLVAVVLARSLADRPWATPDSRLELQAQDLTSLDSSAGWPSDFDFDPRLYFDGGAAGRQLVVSAENGSAGTYLINIRRPNTIREVCRATGGSFVALELDPGSDVAGMSVRLFDPVSGVETGIYSLSDYSMDSLGKMSIPVDELSEGESLAAVLYDGVESVDAVQVGDGTRYGEGLPLLNGKEICFKRLAGIDTNDNRTDFFESWIP